MLHATRAALVSAAVVASSSTAHALVPRSTPAAADVDLVATDAAAVAEPVRDHVELTWDRPLRPEAWQRFVAGGGRWQAGWDAATKVPSRIWGTGIVAPGSVASPAVAAAWARATLASHLDLLAPGARLDDFELVSNVLVDGIRVVGFAQRHGGLRVVGGQVSFRFKRDRLFVIGSEALPDVRGGAPTLRAASSALAARARDATARDLGLARAVADAPGEPVVLPLVGARRVLGFRVVVPVDVDAGVDGRWTVYVDPALGEPVARRSLRSYATGTLVYEGARYPGAPRSAAPAARARIKINGADATTDGGGRVSWSPEAPATVVSTAVGDLVKITNKAGEAATGHLTLAPGGTAMWAAGDNVEVDAQIQPFVHVRVVKEYVRGFAPDLTFLDEQIPVAVNIDDNCNAFYDGNGLNFLKASPDCQNTALLGDVIYHEFGHAVHGHALIPGAGRFDGAFSEGLSDFLAASITGDPGMGRGFYYDDEPLRDIDPGDREHVWPTDIGEIHFTGLIFAGAMWDLRKALIAELGDTAGVALTNRLFIAAVRGSSSIPTTLIEILAADDDDGDLGNGTPHECTIRAVFGVHGLRTVVGAVDRPPGALVATDDQTATPIQLRIDGVGARCPSDQIERVTLKWTAASGGGPAAGEVAMTGDGALWRADLPLPPDGKVLLYQMVLRFADGSESTFPSNRASPWYQLYQGEVEQLYCTDFETDPFAEGWTHHGEPADADIWEWGPPRGGSAGDPAAAYDGAKVVGTNLSTGDGSYGKEGQFRLMWLRMPTIDLGRWTDVHLQYWRWLSVEDGYFDQARVIVDDEVAWENYNSNLGNSSTTHHQDIEWTFHDVPISSRARGTDADILFKLETDRGLAFGGWNIDQLCVVANVKSVCGDGVVTGVEQCDDAVANADGPDTCRLTCRLAACGDGILDSDEECDDGNRDGGDDCSPVCQFPATVIDQCECTTGATPGGAAPIALALGLLLRRRRRRQGGGNVQVPSAS